MLLSDDVVGMRLEIGVKTSAPSSVRENLSHCGRRLHWRHRLPMTVGITFAPTMVRGDEDLHPSRPSGGKDLPHMLNDIVRLECRAAEFVKLATLRQEVIVRIDDKQPGQLRFVIQLSFRHVCHISTPSFQTVFQGVANHPTLDATLNDAGWTKLRRHLTTPFVSCLVMRC